MFVNKQNLINLLKMEKPIITNAIIIVLVFFIIDVNAQQNYTVTLKMPPPGTLNISDLWNVMVTNNSGSEQSGYLTGTAREDKDGMIAKGTTVPILFKKGVNNIKIKDLPKTPDVEYMASDQRYKESLVRHGKFPSGKYEICVKFISSSSNEELGSDCINQEVSEEGMLTLISPADGEQTDSKTPVIFSWSSGGKTPVGGYTLKICEVMKGQTPETALENNRTFYEMTGVKTSNLKYPNSAKTFEEGKEYAWMVKAGNAGSNVHRLIILPGGQTINLVLTPIPCQIPFLGCCFSMSITGNSTFFINSFKLTSSANTVTSVNLVPGLWESQLASGEILVKKDNQFTMGSSIGTICFAQSSASFPVSVMWSTNSGAAFFGPPDLITLQCPSPCPTSNCTIEMCVDWITGSGNFGTVQAGQTVTNQVKISNCGTNGDLYVSPLFLQANSKFSYSYVSTTGTAFSSNTPYTGYILSAGKNVIFDVTFSPTAAGLKTETWFIAQNSTNYVTQNPYPILLTGTGNGTMPCSGITLNMTGVTGTDPNYFIHFGSVCTPVTKIIQIKNAATSCNDLTFTPGSLGGPFSVNASGSMYTKNPGDYENFEITYTPVMGASQQTWIIPNNSNNPNLSGLTITVDGTGVSSTITNMTVAPPAILNFGNVSLTTAPLTKTKIIRVTNSTPSCGPDLHLSAWSVTIGPYTITSTYTSGSALPAPGNYAEFIVTFDPTVTGFGIGNDNWQTFTFTHDATNPPGPTYSVELRGRGTP